MSNEEVSIDKIYREIDNQINDLRGKIYKEITQLRNDNTNNLESIYIQLTELSQILKHLSEKIDDQKQEDIKLSKRIEDKNKDMYNHITDLENKLQNKIENIDCDLSERVSYIENDKVPNLENEIGNIKTKLNTVVALIIKIFLLLLGMIGDIFTATSLVAIFYVVFF